MQMGQEKRFQLLKLALSQEQSKHSEMELIFQLDFNVNWA